MSSLKRELGQAKVLAGPKVSFASILKVGTEPEGWYVDFPYAVWVGVNYSPKVALHVATGSHYVKEKPNF
jgi:hypothetical protein